MFNVLACESPKGLISSRGMLVACTPSLHTVVYEVLKYLMLQFVLQKSAGLQMQATPPALKVSVE